MHYLIDLYSNHITSHRIHIYVYKGSPFDGLARDWGDSGTAADLVWLPSAFSESAPVYASFSACCWCLGQKNDLGLQYDLLHATCTESAIQHSGTSDKCANDSNATESSSNKYDMLMQVAGHDCEETQWVQRSGNTCQYTQTEATA